MNYKTVDVADVIGAMFFSNLVMGELLSSSIYHVLSKVHEKDKFICIDVSKSAYLRVLDIADGNVVWNDETIHFKNCELCKNRFLGCYYSMDNQTRTLIDGIVNEVSIVRNGSNEK